MRLKKLRNRVSSRGNFDVKGSFDSFSDYRSKVDRRRRVTISVLLLCAAIASLVAANYWMHYRRIYPGVEVGGVDLGGKAPEEAYTTLKQRAGELKEIRFTGPEESTLSAEQLGLNYDVQATVDKAYAVGRQGSIVERIEDRIKATWGTVSIPAVADYKRDVVRSEIENLAARENEKPKDAYVDINGATAEVVESQEGYAVDVDATMANVDRALESMGGEVEIVGDTLEPQVPTTLAEEAAKEAQEAMSSGPMVLSAENKQWTITPEEIGKTLSFTPEDGKIQVSLDRDRLKDALSEVYKDLEVEPVDAGFKFNDTEDGTEISLTESQTGKKIDEEKLFGAIESGLFNGERNYEVPLETVEPKLTSDEAQKIMPTALIGSYRTNYTLTTDKSPERVENLRIASNAITGKLLAPGEVFSLDDIAAPLNYNKTSVIVGGKEDKADGGGLCQVTSTLYDAANYADLEILERHPHYAQLPYIRPGMDATVWFGSLDMKFKNSTDSYILLREYVADDGYIYAQIYGQPTGEKVEMDSEPTYLGADSSEWVTYKKVTDNNGKVLYDDVFHKDTYQPLVDEHGEVIPPAVVPVAPVDP